MSQNEKFTFPNSSLIHGAIIKAPPLSALNGAQKPGVFFQHRRPRAAPNVKKLA